MAKGGSDGINTFHKQCLHYLNELNKKSTWSWPWTVKKQQCFGTKSFCCRISCYYYYYFLIFSFSWLLKCHNLLFFTYFSDGSLSFLCFLLLLCSLPIVSALQDLVLGHDCWTQKIKIQDVCLNLSFRGTWVAQTV